jgi:hypothetical protein
MNSRKREPSKPKTAFPRNNHNSRRKRCQNDPTAKEHGAKREQGKHIQKPNKQQQTKHWKTSWIRHLALEV